MNYKVQVAGNVTNVKVKTDYSKKTKAVVASGVIMARTLDELLDVDLSGVSDKYVIMYDASSQKYKAVNPDDVLTAASSTEISQPGLPNEFVDIIQDDLDNKIDLDAGSF